MFRINLKGRFTPAAVTAAAALAVAGAGSAVADSLVDSGDIRNNSITRADIRDGTLSGKDMKKKTVRVSHLTVSARAALKGQTGPRGPMGFQGPKGDQGAKGDKGDKGDIGPSSTASRALASVGSGAEKVTGFSLAPGNYLVTAKFGVVGGLEAANDFKCELSREIGMDPLLDEVDSITEDLSIGEKEEIVLHGAVSVTEASSYRIHCAPSNKGVTFNNVKITATKVGAIEALS